MDTERWRDMLSVLERRRSAGDGSLCGIAEAFAAFTGVVGTDCVPGGFRPPCRPLSMDLAGLFAEPETVLRMACGAGKSRPLTTLGGLVTLGLVDTTLAGLLARSKLLALTFALGLSGSCAPKVPACENLDGDGDLAGLDG